MILLQTATLINLFSSVINDNSAGKLSEVAIKSSLSWVYLSTEKAYSSFPLLKNLELILLINTFLLHGLNPRPSLYNASAKNHLNCLQNVLFERFRRHFWLSQIFDHRLLFDYKQLCIWLLEVSKHDEPGNNSKNQRLKPLRKGEFYLIISVSFTLVISFIHLFQGRI